MSLLLILACSSVDPELAARGKAVRAWREGVDALDRDPARADKLFARAHDAHPHVLLEAWRADAEARGGDLAAAVERLTGVVEQAPGFGEARYNRAAYLARLGQLDEAGTELELALQTGVRRARQAMVDPDFAPHLEHPAFSFLPDELLMVSIDVPKDTLFWGNEARVRVRVLGGEAAPIEVEGEITGPLWLLRAEEGVVDTTQGPSREVEWVFRVDGEGTTTVGPLVVRSAGHESSLSARTFETTAPPGRDGASRSIEPLVMQEGLPQQVGASYDHGVLWVRYEPGDRVVLEPPPGQQPVQLKLLDRSRLTAVLERYELDQKPSVEIYRLGEKVFAGP